jgi:iron(III) transport system substrate-binding protein
LFSFSSCDSGVDDSTPQVTLYCSVDQIIAEEVVARFEKESGIDVLVRYDSEASKTVGLVQRIRAEQKLPMADVFWSSEIFHTIRLAREGLLQPYRGEQTTAWPRAFCDDAGQWYGFGLRGRVIAYNTRRVDSSDAPKSLEDLLNRKWQDRIVMATPSFGTTGGEVASWFAHYGDARAKAILEGLKANGVRLVDGNSTAVRMLWLGQADICLTDTDDVYAAQRNGWPIEMIPNDQGDGGSLVIPNTVAQIKNGPHPDTAGALMEFLLSETTERLLAESDSHNYPVRKELQGEFGDYNIPSPLEIDYERIGDVLTLAIKVANEVFD